MESSSGNGSRASFIIAERTLQCLSLINDPARNELAGVILLLGRTGVGKSSLLEYLTGALGHSQEANDPVTTEFQIEEKIINGKQYFFMDTPGFDAGTESEAFREIARGIQTIRRNARIVGVLYVTKINHSRVETIDHKLLNFIQSFCGDDYIPHITFVTTHWTASLDWEKARYNAKLRDLKPIWEEYLVKGAKLYQHGREYKHGLDTGNFLCWCTDRLQIAEYGKDMISRHYGNTDSRSPRIVQELDANIPLESTAAATFLGLSPASASAAPEATPREQSEQESSQDSPPAQDEAPQQEEESSRTTPPDTNQAEGSRAWSQLILDYVANIAQNTTIEVTGDGVSFTFSSGGRRPGRDRIGFTGGSSQPHGFRFGGLDLSFLDPNSVVDFLNSRGQNSSFANREHLAASLGINEGPTGSARQNIALLKALRG